ncbi:MAG: LapA family protein [Alkalispirochaeta sp.]|jgi:uncharacterized integral membrane protein
MFRLIIGIVIGIIIFIFAIQNVESVDYTFLAWTLIAPRAVVVIGTFIVGLFSGWLISGFRNIRRRK